MLSSRAVRRVWIGEIPPDRCCRQYDRIWQNMDGSRWSAQAGCVPRRVRGPGTADDCQAGEKRATGAWDIFVVFRSNLHAVQQERQGWGRWLMASQVREPARLRKGAPPSVFTSPLRCCMPLISESRLRRAYLCYGPSPGALLPAVFRMNLRVHHGWQGRPNQQWAGGVKFSRRVFPKARSLPRYRRVYRNRPTTTPGCPRRWRHTPRRCVR